MDEVICSKTAFRYWRCPPQVRDLYPPLPDNQEGWRRLRAAPFVCDVLKTPIYYLQSPSECRVSSGTRMSVLLSEELAPGLTEHSELGLRTASPLLTLWTLARALSFYDLVLAMYELCGRFSIFRPAQAIEDILAEADGDPSLTQTRWPTEERWSRVISLYSCGDQGSGYPTMLWMRPPLIDVYELHEFALRFRSLRWGRKFYEASRCVIGMAASPLEVQAALLFSLPRDVGGYGFSSVYLNDFTPLNVDAQKLVDSNNYVGDIVVVNPDTMRAVLVECQGEVVHGSGAVLSSDASRMTALQASGYDVILIDSSILVDRVRFEVIVKTVCDRIGATFVSKSPEELLSEAQLRSQIFCNWELLSSSGSRTAKNRYGRKSF